MFSHTLTLLLFVSCALVAQGSPSSNFVVRRGAAPTANPRHVHITKRAPPHSDFAKPKSFAKREIKTRDDGGIVIPLHSRQTARDARHGERVVGVNKAASLKKLQNDDTRGSKAKKPKDDNSGAGGGGNTGSGGGGGGGGGTTDPPADPPAGQPAGNSTIILDMYYAFNVTLDGIDTSIDVDCTGDLTSNGPEAYTNPFEAPAASDTGLTWKHLIFGGKVHKADFSFGDGAYTFKDVAYGDQVDSPKYNGAFGVAFPGASSFPEGSPRSIADALATDYNITSFAVVGLDEFELLLGVDPYADVDPKALVGSVAAETNGWYGKGTFNGTAITADFSPQNTNIYGNADQIQAFFGDQQPTTRGDDNPSKYYDVDCDAGGPPIEFTFGDTSKDGAGIIITLSGQATLFADKKSSTGCTSVLIGQTPDPERFETSWSLGYTFQYHATPSYVFTDPKAPYISFFNRPASLDNPQ